MQHTSKIFKTFELYTYNMHRILVWPPPSSVSGRRRSTAVAGGEVGWLPCQGLTLLLALSASLDDAGSGAGVAAGVVGQAHGTGAGAAVGRAREAGVVLGVAWHAHRRGVGATGRCSEAGPGAGGRRGVEVGNTATDATDANGESIALSFFE
jgi:hypothetical protein